MGNLKRNEVLSELTSRKMLTTTSSGEEVVQLTSSNTYSQGHKTMTLRDYVHYTTNEHNDDEKRTAANETFYMFGGNSGGIYDIFNAAYVLPPCIWCAVAGARSLGIAGRKTGVSFHIHGPVYSEIIIGRKRWFLFPPDEQQQTSSNNLLFQPSSPSLRTTEIEPNMTVQRWVDDVYDALVSTDEGAASSRNNQDVLCGTDSDGNCTPRQKLYECVVGPGQIIYLPPNWLHATLNLDEYNVFMSLFIDPQLIPKR